MKIPVLIPSIFDHPFTYENDNIKELNVGDFVKVPFGSKELIGLVWDFETEIIKKTKIKKIISKIDIPQINIKTIKFINWFSNYNLVPLGMALKMCLFQKGVIEKNYKDEFLKYKFKKFNNKYKLNQEQNESLKYLIKTGDNYNVSVIEGVTGSGKTLVYFERIKKIISNSKQALVMLPEITLTDQFSEKFENFFGVRPAIWHSKTPIKEKKIIWKGVITNKIKLVVGARSSLFLPFKKLGIIVVDEEHDPSYKQDEGIRYNARDMAVARCYLENIPINLVTSVPSIETFNNIKNKKYNVTVLKKRYNKASFPIFEIISLKLNSLSKGKWIAQKTIDLVNQNLKRGNQILFFLNRRGFAPFAICKKCNKKMECPNCSVNLNFHKKLNKLICHYCGFSANEKRKCINKLDCDLIYCGPGVERIEQELKKIFPNKVIEIFSSDTLKKSKVAKNIIKKIENKEINILVGTQLISKGFHFPKLNCIVVVDTDLTSHGYDLRSAERNVQLYHQLSGRAGRTGDKSIIYFQTYDPKDEILLNIAKNNPRAFLNKELLLRKEKKLPPFFKLISLIISGDKENLVNNFALKIKLNIPNIKNVEILGPVNAPIFKIKRSFRSRILIRYPHNLYIQRYISGFLKKNNTTKKNKTCS